MKLQIMRATRATVLGLALLGVGSTAAEAKLVSGSEVAIVTFEGGSFRVISTGKWAEIDAAGKVTGQYDEVGRTRETVLIQDAARGVLIVIDMKNGKITFGTSEADQQALYDILDSEATASAPTAVPGAPATGMTVTVAMHPAGEFRLVGKGKWVEVNADGLAAFRFNEVSRDAGAVALEDRSRDLAVTLDLRAGKIMFGAIGGEQGVLYDIVETSTETLDASAATASDDPPTINNPLDDFLARLNYDPRRVLRRPADGATETLTGGESPVRERGSNSVIITTTKRSSIDKEVSDLTILNGTAGVIYPGALVLADTDLMDGRPTPIGLLRSPVTISTDLPGMKDAKRVVRDPTQATVQNALNEILDDYNNNASQQGYLGAARASFSYANIFTSQQASAELGFAATWADGEAAGMVKASGDANSTSVVAFFKQVFYTVSMDTPRYPSEVFSKDLTVKSLARVVSDTAPPAYVRSVDYGRILMVRMDTAALTAKADAIGAFKQAIEGGEVEGYAKAKYEQINRKSTFSAVVLGGATTGIVKFAATEDGVKNLKAFIEEGVSYTKSNPGIPVSYNVAFLNTNKMATIGLSTNYTERESIEYPNGYVKIRHGGWYVARIRVTWEEAGVPKAWTSGDITRSGNVMTVDVPGDAKSLKIVAEGATGIAWDPWDEAMNVTLSGPDNRCYSLQGTTLDQSYAVSATPQDPCP